ncbi:MAG: hypothetical protein JXB46_02945 [Candidatus Eisenbacteria bacterium]|nr:hypothetical protein [Candidatus Eisenbacteria bacterium]
MDETRNELLRTKMDGADTPEAKKGVGFCGTCIHFPVPMGNDAHVGGPCLADDPPIRTHASSTCKRIPNMWLADDSAGQIEQAGSV